MNKGIWISTKKVPLNKEPVMSLSKEGFRGLCSQKPQDNKMKIYYNPKLKARARELRNNSTLSEVLLWNQLKARKMKGYQFMRQKPIGNYIVDFFCSKLKLVIEIDGENHLDKVEYDKKRQQELEAIGLSFLRFSDLGVKSNLNGVLQMIEKWIEQPPDPL